MTVETKVKVGGAWKVINTIEVKVGGVWKAMDTIEAKVAGVWKKVHEVISGPQVSPNTSNAHWNKDGAGFCYSMLQFNLDGTEYRNNPASVNTTTWNVRGAWLDSGLNSEVWIERVITASHSLNEADPGAGRKVLSTSRLYGVNKGGPGGFKLCQLEFKFYDAASGGNQIGSSGVITLRAAKNGG